MTTAAPALLSPADLLDQQAGDAQRYRALLHELMDMGMGLARTVHGHATAQGADPATACEAAITFDLLSRAVRRTVALARRVAEPLPVRPDPARERAAARQRSVRDVADLSQWSDDELDAEIAREFRAELCERLDRAELGDEIGHRPIEDVIADIYRDLGLGRFPGGPPRAAQPPAAPGSAAPVPPASPLARHVEPRPGWRPFTPEGGMEPQHEARAVQNE